MKILLDESVPVQVRNALLEHDVASVSGLGWKGRENGELLAAAELSGFEVLILADKNLRYQQDLASRRIAIVELWTNHRPTLENNFHLISAAVRQTSVGAYIFVSRP